MPKILFDRPELRWGKVTVEDDDGQGGTMKRYFNSKHHGTEVEVNNISRVKAQHPHAFLTAAEKIAKDQAKADLKAKREAARQAAEDAYDAAFYSAGKTKAEARAAAKAASDAVLKV